MQNHTCRIVGVVDFVGRILLFIILRVRVNPTGRKLETLALGYLLDRFISINALVKCCVSSRDCRVPSMYWIIHISIPRAGPQNLSGNQCKYYKYMLLDSMGV